MLLAFVIPPSVVVYRGLLRLFLPLPVRNAYRPPVEEGDEWSSPSSGHCQTFFLTMQLPMPFFIPEL